MTAVLITGGTGFLGRHLALSLRGQHDVFLGARNNAQNATAAELTGCKVLPLDVTDVESVRDVFAEVQPSIVIHAAASKFVDLGEKFPIECTAVNVNGSVNVARVAVEKHVRTVIGISTDKAAPPIRNTYGLTKALMERLFCNLNTKTDTKFACVRFGNLAWSTGSVLPLWQQMHDATGVIRSTGPEMWRFFISASEASSLVQTAMERIDQIQGKVLSRAMKGVQMRSLLNVWVQEKGGRWEKVKARPGERRDELLIGDSERSYTSVADYDGARHYVLSFNEEAAAPLAESLSAEHAVQLSPAEMTTLIQAPTA